jgi:hypothetical protein
MDVRCVRACISQDALGSAEALLKALRDAIGRGTSREANMSGNPLSFRLTSNSVYPTKPETLVLQAVTGG